MPKLTREVRLMVPDEMQVFKVWRKLHKDVDEFVYLWSRYKNWESDPPIVALRRGVLCGYHGVSFTKSGYINSMSQFVLEEHRGCRVAGSMIDFLLKEGDNRGMKRLRFRCPKQGDGLDCWQGFGVKPFGKCDKDYWFDLDISDVGSIADLIRLGAELHKVPTTDKRRISWYRRGNVQVIIPEWKGVI